MLPQRSQRSQRQASMMAAQRLAGDIPNLAHRDAREAASVQSNGASGVKRRRRDWCDAVLLDSRDEVLLDSLGWISGSARNLPAVGLFAAGGAASGAASGAADDMSRYNDDLPIPSGDVYPQSHQDSLEAMEAGWKANRHQHLGYVEHYLEQSGGRDAWLPAPEDKYDRSKTRFPPNPPF